MLSGRRAIVAVLVGATVVAPLTVAAARTTASETCAYDAATQTISIDLGDTAELGVSRRRNHLLLGTVNAPLCPGATLSGTRRVNVSRHGSEARMSVVFSQREGRLEISPSALTFMLDNASPLAGDTASGASVVGTSGPDVMTSTMSDGVDLDGDGVFDIVPAAGQLLGASLSGEDGNDVLHTESFARGGNGNDTLYGPYLTGNPGNDTLYGLAPPTDLYGHDAQLDGWQGNDVIYAPRRVPAHITGARGNDVIHARQGQADVIDGGPGRDSGEFDDSDTVTHVP